MAVWPRCWGSLETTWKSLKAKIAEGMDADMVITSAGVSKGDYDIVKDVLAEQGEISFWMVKMKPARPLAFGVLKSEDGKRRVPHLGLPGNPVSSMIAFEQFGRPALRKMQGHKNLTKPTVTAIMEDTVVNTDARRVFARGVVTRRNGQYYVKTTGPQGSGILTSMSLANGLAIVPEEVAEVGPGGRGDGPDAGLAGGPGVRRRPRAGVPARDTPYTSFGPGLWPSEPKLSKKVE